MSTLAALLPELGQLSGRAISALVGVAPLARTLYPNLELIVHGAVNFAPYRSRFDAFLEGSHAETDRKSVV